MATKHKLEKFTQSPSITDQKTTTKQEYLRWAEDYQKEGQYHQEKAKECQKEAEECEE